MNRQLLHLALPLATVLAATLAAAQNAPLPGYLPQYSAPLPAGPATVPQGTLSWTPSGQPPASPAWSGALPANLSDPAGVLREGIDKLRTFLSYAGNQEPAQVTTFLEREIAPYFDFGYMAYLVAGPVGQHMSQEQRLQFRDALRAHFLAAMAQNLSRYQSGELQYLPPVGWQDDQRLRVRVVQRGQPPVLLEFRLYPGQGGWKIYDVAANGLSAVQYFRQNAGQLLRGVAPAMGPGPR